MKLYAQHQVNSENTNEEEQTNEKDDESDYHEGGINIEAAKERMKKEDKLDRQRERKRIRERHKEEKRKERQERIESTTVRILSFFYSCDSSDI